MQHTEKVHALMRYYKQSTQYTDVPPYTVTNIPRYAVPDAAAIYHCRRTNPLASLACSAELTDWLLLAAFLRTGTEYGYVEGA
jgi:hypothetical protein